MWRVMRRASVHDNARRSDRATSEYRHRDIYARLPVSVLHDRAAHSSVRVCVWGQSRSSTTLHSITSQCITYDMT